MVRISLTVGAPFTISSAISGARWRSRLVTVKYAIAALAKHNGQALARSTRILSLLRLLITSP